MASDANRVTGRTADVRQRADTAGPGDGRQRPASGLSVDDGLSQMIDVEVDASSSDKHWAKAVGDNARTLTFTQTVAAPGRHTIRVRTVDPGAVLQQLVVGQPKASSFRPPAGRW